MNYFTSAPQELGRKAERAMLCFRIWKVRRALAQAETELGLLGWQQAEFDPETERQVSEIRDVEKEQARLMNAVAERSSEVRRIHAEYGAALREHLEARKTLESERARIKAPQAELEARLAEQKKIEPNFLRRIPELDRELREVSAQYSALLAAEHHTPKMRDELVRARERTVAIPNEKSDLRTQHLRTVSEIRSIEETLAGIAVKEAEVSEKLKAEEAAWMEREKEIAGRTKDEEREKAKLEKQIAQLDAAKANPYQRIGRVLAASNIAPMNQPEALDKVKELDGELADLLAGLEQSRAQTAEHQPQVRLISYAIWALLGAILIGLVWLLR